MCDEDGDVAHATLLQLLTTGHERAARVQDIIHDHGLLPNASRHAHVDNARGRSSFLENDHLALHSCRPRDRLTAVPGSFIRSDNGCVKQREPR